MKNTFLETHIIKALGLQSGETISVVGGGGKTSVINKLAKEASQFHSCPIFITTTTNIFYPDKELKYKVILGTEETIAATLKTKINTKNKILTLARKKMGAQIIPNQPDKNLKKMKLKGFKKESIRKFITNDRIIFIEADGSKGLPIKAPNKNEPVIPQESDYTIGVIGLDSIGLTASPKNVFRHKEFCKITGLKEKMEINAESLALLIKHPNGIFQNTPQNAKKAIVLNKADCIENIDEIRKIAYIINKLACFPSNKSDRLIVTSCCSSKPSLVYMHK